MDYSNKPFYCQLPIAMKNRRWEITADCRRWERVMAITKPNRQRVRRCRPRSVICPIYALLYGFFGGQIHRANFSRSTSIT
jgi:hypothetical protein